MKRILVMGALGQIGSELTLELKRRYGDDNIIASDIREDKNASFDVHIHDCTDGNRTLELVQEHKIDTIYHLPALLSATAETHPQKAWDINMNGLYATLEVARTEKCAVFTPSTIGAFGSSTPKAKTPQDTIMRPETMYGVSKVAGELLCDYYFQRFGVDTRGVRYPGIISNKTLPGGGTTDYAVEIYYEAIKNKAYTSYIRSDSFMDMMYMPDAIKAAIDVMEADPTKLVHRNAFNVTSMSLNPEILAESIRKFIPEFIIDFDVDPIRQAIADSWPDSLDDSAARIEWNWQPDYNLEKMTEDMITVLREKLA